uniref:Uncharacterized protein n=1 Tax=Neogobius melanostomus TaxID=47308 RepID=A0A8C6TXC0_9GOBI
MCIAILDLIQEVIITSDMFALKCVKRDLCVFYFEGDLCVVNHCSNGGTCVTGAGSELFCICPDDFTGDNCTERETGPCSPNPCVNDGQCEVVSEKRRGDVFSQYYCNCPPETKGSTVRPVNINECQEQPCLNGGSCSDLSGDFTCRCPSPYVGKRCQLRELYLTPGLGAVISRPGRSGSSSGGYTSWGLQRWGPELVRSTSNSHGLQRSRTQFLKLSPQVDLTRVMRVSGLVSQGAGRLGYSEFVKAFKVAFSLNGTGFSFYQRDGKDVVRSSFLVVCRRACTGCSEPMGLRSRLIQDSQISGSSSFRTWGLDSFTWRPHFARLDKQGKTNAWSAAVNDQSQWIQVDLGSLKKLTGIITQVSYSEDGERWTTVKDRNGHDKIFPGNTDNNVHKKNRFEPALFGRFLRVEPWDWHHRITMRLELLGCSQ